MINVLVVSRLRERMNPDDRAFAQKLLRVILASPQLQTSIGMSLHSLSTFLFTSFQKAQAICPRTVTALLQNEQFKTGCIQEIAKTFDQNQVTT